MNVSSSAPISQSNVIFGSPNGSGLSTQTGSIVVSGSNNILMAGPRADTLAALGTYGYIGGNNNIIANQSTLTIGSVLRPVMTNNIGLASISQTYTTSSLATPVLSNNTIVSNLTINHNSSSLTFQNNNVGVGFTSNANTTILDLIPTITTNQLVGSLTTLNHNSSSIQYTQNVGAINVTNNYSSSVSVATNNVTVSQNFAGGSNQQIIVTGSNSSGTRRTFNSNFMMGRSNIVNSDYIGSTGGHLVSTGLIGQELIVSASHTSTTVGGTVVVGRYNATGSLQESSQDTVFVVGTGTSATARRNAIHVDSSNNTRITGSVSISGSLTLNGASVTNRDGLITTGSIGTTQSVTGSLVISGSAVITGSVAGNVNSVSISSNTASLNLNNSNFFTLQLVSGSDTRIETSNIKDGQTINILLNTTGSATVSFPTYVKQVSGSAYVPSTGTTKDIITLVSFDNTTLYLANVKNLI